MTASSPITEKQASAVFSVNDRRLTVKLAGWLDALAVAGLWHEANAVVAQNHPAQIVVEAAGVTYCDGAGAALLIDLERKVGAKNFQIQGLPENYQKLLEMFDVQSLGEIVPPKPKHVRLPDQVGLETAHLGRDLRLLVSFVGELAVSLSHALRHPRSVRWRDTLLIAERAGVDALPIVALISFLMGLIMAFQSAVPMKQFGVEIYVANLVGLAMLRELGPLMTAIVLAGRSGSAFAAEIGTMKVNEEVNALSTMGLEPVRFLVVPRVLAGVAVMPLLAVFANLMGLAGGAVVLLSMGYPLVTYVNQVTGAAHLQDLLTGLFKSFVFGILVAGIGCLRGLQTKTGASAVGLSATSAVVSGIILVVVADGIFSVIFYYLGI